MPNYCPVCGRENSPTARFCSECGTPLTSGEADKPILLDNRYQVQSIVKSGAMGAVFRAVDTRLGTVVAVKQMLAYYTTPEERRRAEERFKEEAMILSQLHHGGLPKVTDYFIETDSSGKTSHYLVMTFIEGKDFESFVEHSDMPLPVDEALEYFRQILDILAYLHSRTPPIIYRDVKPSNIMISEGRLYLVDFGIAMIFDARRKGTMMGTPGYAAPEQYKGFADTRSDLYALGAFMHFLLTGKDPMDTSQPPFTFEPIRKLNPQVPEYLENIIMSMLDFEPDNRPASAVKILDMLDARTAAPYRAKTSRSAGPPAARPQMGPVSPPAAVIPVRRTRAPLVPFRDYEGFWQAVKRGDFSLTDDYLNHGADPNIMDTRGWTPLHEAASQGNEKILALLLQAGGDPDIRDNDGRAPLHEAVYKQSKGAVELLLKSGADVNAEAVLELTPLYIAASSGNREIVQILIQHGADVNAPSSNGWTPLHKAASNDFRSIASQLLKSDANVNARSREGWTPLHLAARQGHEHLTVLLIQHGADVTAATEEGILPADLARRYGHEEVLEILLEAVKRYEDLYRAAQRNDVREIQSFVDQGAFLDIRDVNGRTPLHHAALFGSPDAARLFIKAGVNVNAQDNEGKTPLFLAARSGKATVAHLLLQNGAEVSRRTIAGWTPLHEAAKYGNANVVSLLLQAGADPGIPTPFSGTALDLAERFNHPDVAALLLQFQ